MAFAIMRLEKLHTVGQIGALGRHNERTRETPNADPERRAENVRLRGSGDWLADAQARLAEVDGRIRSNAVLAIEHIFTASSEWFEQASPRQVEAWVERSMDWLEELYGARNIVAAVQHEDERTPHVQALVVPVTEEGRLSAHAFIGGSRNRLVELQDSYAARVQDLGLERGVRGSPAEHQEVRDWYARLEQPLRAVEEIREELSVAAPPRVSLNPETWATRESARLAETVGPTLAQAVTQAQHYAFEAERAQGQVQALVGRVRALEGRETQLVQERDQLRERVQQYEQRAVEQARTVPLERVLERLGAERDAGDRQQWWLEGERLSVQGEKFYHHDQARGGGGAIDLVQQTLGYDFRQAMAWLGAEMGRDLAVQTAQQTVVQAYAREGRPAFVPPVEVAERWGQVRQYLVEERGLSAALVEQVHQRGDLYATERQGHPNAVFVCRGEDGTVTGASLRGVEPGSHFQGLAAGSQRAEGRFVVTDPGEGIVALLAPDLIITESPIDALSLRLLREQRTPEERGAVRIVSTDGAGPLPEAEIQATQREGGRIYVATDNDRAGEQIYRRIKELCPGAERQRPALKDANDDLRHPEEAAAIRAARQEAAQQHRAELARIARLSPGDAVYAREVYQAYRGAQAEGQSRQAAAVSAAVAFARVHNGLGEATLRAYVAAGLPRSGGISEREIGREAREAAQAALEDEQVLRAHDGHERGR